MSIRLHWNPTHSNVLHMTFEQGWTLQAYYHSIAALESMVNSHPQPVMLIMDLSQAPAPAMRYTVGRNVDEARATRNVSHIALVKPGNFMPLVNCPVEIVDQLEDALSRLMLEPVLLA